MTDTTQRRFFTRTPLWVLLIVPFTLLIAAVVAVAVRRTVQGRLPICADCVRDRRRFVGAALAVWVVDVVVFLLAIRGSAVALLAWLVLSVAALVFTFMGDHFRVSGTVSKDGWWVELRGASEIFVREINLVVQPQAAPYPSAQPAAQNPPVLSPTPAVSAPPAEVPSIAAAVATSSSQTILPQ